jgi:protein gp37
MRDRSYYEYYFRPWTGCQATASSPGCRLCPAWDFSRGLREVQYHRTDGYGSHRTILPIKSDPSVWEEPLRWDSMSRYDQEKPRVSCMTGGDPFAPFVPPSWRKELFDLIAKTPNLRWDVVTRRPHEIVRQLEQIGYLWKLPLPNLRMGIAAENQECFDRRWAAFREFPLANKLLVYRPPLGAIKLPADAQGQLEEVIFGGGFEQRLDPAFRCDPAWKDSVTKQCADMGIKFNFAEQIDPDAARLSNASVVHASSIDQMDLPLVPRT